MKNPIQCAYDTYKRAQDGLDTVIHSFTPEAIQGYLNEIDRLGKDVWFAVADATKRINRNLASDTERRPFTGFTSSDICFLDKNWQILKGNKCPHCGEIHLK